jgi:hypothetical protein
MSTIQPHYVTFGELLTNRLFRIPEYQRAYSWESRQRADLFADIEATMAFDEDRQHFMATIVGLRRNNLLIGTDRHRVIEVIDGQQRLTTLIILLKSLQLRLNADLVDEQKAADDLGYTLVKPSDGTLLLLQTNHDTTHIFRNYMTTGAKTAGSSVKTISDRHLASAITECERFVGKWVERYGSALSLLAVVKNRLSLIIHETDDERAVYSVFEVLNSRGLEVQWLDRLKSSLMGAAFELPGENNAELIDELRVAWADIYSCIGLRQGMNSEALRFAATLIVKPRPNKPLGERDSVEVIRGSATTAQGMRRSASWLLAVTQACDWVRSQERLNAVTDIFHARVLLAALYLRDDLDYAEKADLFQVWEKVTFRVFVLHNKDSRTGVGNYMRLAWSIINETPISADIRQRLLEIGADYPLDEGVEALRKTDCYTEWQNVLLYIFFRREERLSQQKKQKFSNEQWERIWLSSASDSIEHIWPQSKAPASQMHRLGNLFVLPPKLNSRLGALDPKDKKDEYVQTGLLIAQEVAQKIDGTWKGSDIDAREDELIGWMKAEWA